LVIVRVAVICIVRVCVVVEVIVVGIMRVSVTFVVMVAGGRVVVVVLVIGGNVVVEVSVKVEYEVMICFSVRVEYSVSTTVVVTGWMIIFACVRKRKQAAKTKTANTTEEYRTTNPSFKISKSAFHY